ncbi:hypothetical protein M23134_02767 [Microscilla marina ATCC 23134]|uniref:Uncharacterized protein n=1 Tax=Microscilla marina ATCC 23134 TaxID=313606 RepID=A1ZWF7_MICM2|nr:hypothetical protein M23134_02767 [Microscilla marina ATCC 23134]
MFVIVSHKVLEVPRLKLATSLGLIADHFFKQNQTKSS